MKEAPTTIVNHGAKGICERPIFWIILGSLYPVALMLFVLFGLLITGGPDGLIHWLGSIPLWVATMLVPPVLVHLIFGQFYISRIRKIRMNASRTWQITYLIFGVLVLAAVSNLLQGLFPMTLTGVLIGTIASSLIPLVIAVSGVLGVVKNAANQVVSNVSDGESV